MTDRPTRPETFKWQTVGMYLTAIWMFCVVAYTNADRQHPLFDYIFSVPLLGWIAAVLVNRRIERKRRPPRRKR